MKHRGPAGITRECSKCGGDLGELYRKHRYCKKCKAAYEKVWRAGAKERLVLKTYNEAIIDVLKIVKNRGELVRPSTVRQIERLTKSQ